MCWHDTATAKSGGTLVGTRAVDSQGEQAGGVKGLRAVEGEGFGHLVQCVSKGGKVVSEVFRVWVRP